MMVRQLPRNVILLGVVSLLADISSEMLYPLIPLFLTGTLGTSVAAAGVIEGFAEMTASLLRGVSGAWSDRAGRRKPFVFAGYSISAAGKALLGLAFSWTGVLAARIVDRFGKGLRSTARDAMLAESTPAFTRGLAFGFHRSMDQTGAVVGPLLALPLLAWFNGDYRAVFLVGFIPGAAAALLVLMTRDTGAASSAAPASPLGNWRAMPPVFRRYLLVSALFAIGNSADAWILLRAKAAGMTDRTIVLLFALFNAVTVVSAWPSGALSDRFGRRRFVYLGWALFAVAYFGFAGANSLVALIAVFAVYGIYSGIGTASARALCVDLVDPAMKGSAFGWHGLMTGVMVLLANVLAGLLWNRLGPHAPFLFGAACSAAAAVWLATDTVLHRATAEHKIESATRGLPST